MPDPTPGTIDIAPGDWCPGADNDTYKCFGDATCDSNVCVLADSETAIECCDNVQDPATCNQMRCPLGKYCNTAAGQGTCQDVTEIG